jgi:hypothetical protein
MLVGGTAVGGMGIHPVSAIKSCRTIARSSKQELTRMLEIRSYLHAAAPYLFRTYANVSSQPPMNCSERTGYVRRR